MRIAIDMDEVIADFCQKDIATFNRLFKMQLTQDMIGHGYTTTLYPQYNEAMKAIRNDPDFFRDMQVIEGAQEVVAKLNQEHEVFIVTNAMHFPRSVAGKYDWLKTHFPFLTDNQFVFCGNKVIIHADYLIDDSTGNLAVFSGTGLLFSSPHNLAVDHPLRMNSWQEVADYFSLN